MRDWTVIFFTLIIAFVLTLLPMPAVTIWFRPAWVLMLLIYWNMSLPNRINIGFAWWSGLTMDLLNGTLLGAHALGFTIIIYFVNRMHLRLRVYPLLQQSWTVLLLVGLYQLILYSIQGFVGQLPGSHLYWFSAMMSALLWPWFFSFMRDCQQWFRVA